MRRQTLFEMDDIPETGSGRDVGSLKRGWLRLRGWAVILLALTITGCPGITPLTGEDGNVDPDLTLTQGKRVSGEPNGSFSQALDLILDSTGVGRIRGTVYPTTDVDVYNLGPMRAGDRIRVDLDGHGSLDAAIAIFDEGGDLFIMNDDRNANAGQLDPFVNEVVRRDGMNYFLAVSSSAFGPSTGAYTAVVTVGRGESVPPPRPQAILLNFTGGTITIPGDATYTVGTFNAADIDPAYAGQTSVVKRWIVQTVEDCFDGIAVTIYSTDTGRPPANVAYSQVFFGGLNPRAYGISQDVDDYNHNPTDASIVFTEDFTADQFGRRLTVVELGRAIGNVATHEIGHLLGLNHVADPADLMDSTGSAMTFVSVQTFRRSPLDVSIWPFGYQDGLQLLMEIVGTSP